MILAMSNNERMMTLEVDADSPVSRGNRSVVVSLPNQSPTLLLGLLVLGLLISGLQT